MLSYGLVNWVTKGLFLGGRRVHMNPQPDDFFIDNVFWSKGGQTPPAAPAQPIRPSTPTG